MPVHERDRRRQHSAALGTRMAEGLDAVSCRPFFCRYAVDGEPRIAVHDERSVASGCRTRPDQKRMQLPKWTDKVGNKRHERTRTRQAPILERRRVAELVGAVKRALASSEMPTDPLPSASRSGRLCPSRQPRWRFAARLPWVNRKRRRNAKQILRGSSICSGKGSSLRCGSKRKPRGRTTSRPLPC
jgi:hypothetical protein